MAAEPAEPTSAESIASQKAKLDKAKGFLQQLHEAAVIDKRYGTIHLRLVYKDGNIVRIVQTSESEHLTS